MSPIYCYSCEECGSEFETTQKITEDSYTNHSQCSEGQKSKDTTCKGKLRRIIQACSWVLHGPGWTNKFYRGKKRGK
jgi:predicted nucleic acid-binding Zn ribbon protein